MTPWESTARLKSGNDTSTARCDHTAILIGTNPDGGRLYWCCGCGGIQVEKGKWTQPATQVKA
jgi:hypothetical protein